MELDRTARRVLGALIEKRWTTPDQYPLSINALLSACNQKSNRDPVLELLEFEINGCLLNLRSQGLVVVHERDYGRVPRYSERTSEETGLARDELAILAELMLRGPQSVPELYRRCQRMAHFQGADRVEALLRKLREAHYVRELPRESGQRANRWTHLLAPDKEPALDDDEDEVQTPPRTTPAAAASTSSSAGSASSAAASSAHATPPSDDLRRLVEALQARVVDLEERVETLEGLI